MNYAKIGILATVTLAAFASPAPKSRDTSLVSRVDDTGFIEVRADSFKTLDPKQQALAYWLTQASIAIDPIIYDQLSAYGLREKRLLEEIVAHRIDLILGVAGDCDVVASQGGCPDGFCGRGAD